MDGWEFLGVAGRLSCSGGEADLRTSVSRSYYAAYNGLAEALRAEGIDIPLNYQGHAILWKYLAYCEVSSLKTLAKKLNALRDKRNEADYDMSLPQNRLSGGQAKLALKEAEGIRADFQGVGAKQAALAMKEWERKVSPGG